MWNKFYGRYLFHVELAVALVVLVTEVLEGGYSMYGASGRLCA
ncbi:MULTISPECIES: hypothetical protein [Candidatus Ichthyocystis]|nr:MULTISPECIES: hypothetical protein [Ichthyocystis]